MRTMKSLLLHGSLSPIFVKKFDKANSKSMQDATPFTGLTNGPKERGSEVEVRRNTR